MMTLVRNSNNVVTINVRMRVLPGRSVEWFFKGFSQNFGSKIYSAQILKYNLM